VRALTGMRHDRLSKDEQHRRSLLARRRFQLVGALLIGALVPYLIRGWMLPAAFAAPTAQNAAVGNIVAVLITFWAKLSLEPYPGIRSSYVILPAALAGHGVIVTAFLITRLPYDVIALTGGFVLHVLWNYIVYIASERRIRRRFAIVPYGSIPALSQIDTVDWKMLQRPSLADTAKCDAIVADFSADLPNEWEAFLADAALAGRMVYQVKQLSESLTGRVELDHLSENSFGSLVPARGYFHLKAMLDFLIALCVLPLLLPIMAVAAIAVRIEGGGPILFKQRRLGHAGTVFTALKFRTMQVLEFTGEVSAVRKALATDENDPRITRVGRVLRKYRIDEMPQVFNVLKGDMSFIGPRPEPEVLSRWFVAEIPFYRYRHVVRPGISGWAQVNQGYVSGVDGINQKLKYDFYYIKYFSPWLDLLILFKTIKTMFTGSGAR
jgi:lipopolysaccharide/colanic/teichoic acid biosynthesis glycosyltransferase